MKKLTQEEIKEIVRLHGLWVNGLSGGRHANLRHADLSNADLSGADLRHANLRHADLSNANLSGADLRQANLSYANLSYADLSDANLSNADLSHTDLSHTNLNNATGNSREIVTIQTPVYTMVWTKDIIWIGCKSYPLSGWEAITEEGARALDRDEAVTFYKEYKDILLSMFKKFNK